MKRKYIVLFIDDEKHAGQYTPARAFVDDNKIFYSADAYATEAEAKRAADEIAKDMKNDEFYSYYKILKLY